MRVQMWCIFLNIKQNYSALVTVMDCLPVEAICWHLKTNLELGRSCLPSLFLVMLLGDTQRIRKPHTRIKWSWSESSMGSWWSVSANFLPIWQQVKLREETEHEAKGDMRSSWCPVAHKLGSSASDSSLLLRVGLGMVFGRSFHPMDKQWPSGSPRRTV